jgi:hypothetical protein
MGMLALPATLALKVFALASLLFAVRVPNLARSMCAMKVYARHLPSAMPLVMQTTMPAHQMTDAMVVSVFEEPKKFASQITVVTFPAATVPPESVISDTEMVSLAMI